MLPGVTSLKMTKKMSGNIFKRLVYITLLPMLPLLLLYKTRLYIIGQY